MTAAWKGLDRETVEAWVADALAGDRPASDLEEEAAADVIDSPGLRCVGWHAWTGDPATSTPLFVLDAWEPRTQRRSRDPLSLRTITNHGLPAYPTNHGLPEPR